MSVSEKTTGFIAGVCHPRTKTELLKSAGFGWVRTDVPYPFQSGTDGQLADSYISYRDRVKYFHDNGVKTMSVTPYPREFSHRGIDPASADGLKSVTDVVAFIASDLAPYEVGWQVTNELNVFHFRVPLLLEQAAPYIIAGLEGLKKGCPEALRGFNTAGTSSDAKYIIDGVMARKELLDYIGLDSYCGTWGDGEPDDIIAEINAVHDITGLPVLVQEFGFSSAGEIFTMDEALNYLKSLGFDSVDAVKADPRAFINRIPYRLAKMVVESPPEQWADNAINLVPHMLRKWPGGSKIYRHTPEGQAAFYDELLGKMLKNPHICGLMVYCWSDSEICYNCGFADCPCETAWGITYLNEDPKPAYYAIKKHLTE
jgi:hypothetical protein